MTRRRPYAPTRNVKTSHDRISPVLREVQKDGITNTEDLDKLQIYSEEEQDTGKTWIDGKTIFKKVLDLGNLANTGSVATPHGITPDTVISLVGMASSGANARPLPYADTSAASIIELRMGATNITTVTATNYSAWTAFAVIEYTKS